MDHVGLGLSHIWYFRSGKAASPDPEKPCFALLWAPKHVLNQMTPVSPLNFLFLAWKIATHSSCIGSLKNNKRWQHEHLGPCATLFSCFSWAALAACAAFGHRTRPWTRFGHARGASSRREMQPTASFDRFERQLWAGCFSVDARRNLAKSRSYFTGSFL